MAWRGRGGPEMDPPWFFLVGAGVIGPSMFECPRCGKLFFVRWRGSNPFASNV